MTSRGVNLIFGGANIGERFTTVEEVSSVLSKLKEKGIIRIDTAARYPPTNPGASEKLIGEAHAAQLGFVIDTKVNVAGDGRGSLSAEAIAKSIEESLGRLGVDKVNVLYCHRPDDATPLSETAAAFDAHFRKGKFSAWGISNFTPESVNELCRICVENKFVKPAVYQGQYNALCRGAEDKLFAVLNEHGIQFNAFSPLAGGILTGKLTTGGDLSDSRLQSGNALGAFFRSLYDKPVIHAAIAELQEVLDSQALSLPESSIRWLAHHSDLRPDDGILLGASRESQIETSINDIEKGALPDTVVAAFGEMWRKVQAASS
ncbi:aldehyde reductase [Punctularia strigosozonata HHB-11173 SS5]|uniref:aldehyde reductase n=1 Tax=Punctularia strigosozonata (strain HHB-11173) TaxID=741275 RepID=UPI0004417308|nr:aldehyde reductase [Punctularia strigosozonata HHB-11173 SS5]EIN06754.1 aldehyde reductase [Punctularia strigosozonata HHB-11173 SS5]